VLAASNAPAADAAGASDATANSRKNVGNGAWPERPLTNAGDASVDAADSMVAEGPPNVGWPVGEEAMMCSAGKGFRQAGFDGQARLSSSTPEFKHT
jgi:hypothetical protein